MPESHVDTPLLTPRFDAALHFAADVHRTQVRKATTIPYLAHLMSVCALVLENGGDEDLAIAALLHDAVEDADDGEAMRTEIRARFGDRVLQVVDGCSDAVAVPGAAKPPWRQRKEAYLRHIAAERDPGVLLVSACDKLHNGRALVTDLRTLGPAVWSRFSSPDPADHLWYHGSLATLFRGRVPAPLADALRRTFEEMRGLAGGPSAPALV